VKTRDKILVLTTTFPRWRGDKDPPFVLELCRRLAPHFSVTVLAPHFPGSRTKETWDGIRVVRFRYFFTPLERLAYGSGGGILARLRRNPAWGLLVPFLLAGQVAAIARLIRKERFSLIHAHWLIPQALAAILAMAAAGRKIPLLSTAHGGDLYGLQGRAMDRLRRSVFRRSAAVSVVSRAMARDAVRGGARAQSTHVIPMGTDLVRRFCPGRDAPDHGQVLFVGRLVEKKGCRYLIQAWQEVHRRAPAARLVIAGDGPERETLRLLVNSAGLSPSVTFCGAVAHGSLPEMYRSSAVVAFPSVVAGGGDREGFGLVLVEALGCGCAAVVTDLPAMEDIVENETSALVVPQKDSAALARALLRLLGDPALCRRLASEGRRHVLERFAWEPIAARYRELIEKVIERREAAGGR
jgi:glycosyltransferase involved in cell wall biosynthesis